VHYKGKDVKSEASLVEDFIPLCGNCHAMVHMMEDSGAGIRELKDYVRFRQEIRKTKK
jgi:predicted HNH restriction endonuclease